MSFRKALIVLVGLFLAAVVAAALAPSRGNDHSSASPARVERGRYLVASIGCADCHSPKVFGPDGPEPDMTRFLAGHPEADVVAPAPRLPDGWVAATTADLTAWSGPWGISFPINLTPDRNTGIGIWTEDMFVKALKTGRHMGVSREILPPMPWKFFRNLTEDDLGAIFSYLRTIPPVHNRVPEPVPPAAPTTTDPARH